MSGTERFETVIIGGGQAGLAAGYHLARRGRPFVILEGGERIGDSWRSRWSSLRLFSPARYDGLPGWRFPAPGWSFPTKDEMADYLEAAVRFPLSGRSADASTRGKSAESSTRHKFGQQESPGRSLGPGSPSDSELVKRPD